MEDRDPHQSLRWGAWKLHFIRQDRRGEPSCWPFEGAILVGGVSESGQPGAAVITGGTRGIGLAVAKRLAADGRHVLLTYKGDAETAQAAKAALTGSGGQVEIIAADISTADGAGLAIEAAMQAFGRIEVLVNNAGITRDTLLMRMSGDDWDDVLATNLKGAFLTSKAAIRPMLRQRSGRIVNISSVVGQVGNAGQANYAAAKAGLIGFTKSLAKEVGSRGITVNAIAPGFIDTRMTAGLSDEMKTTLLERTPLNRFGTPEDVAGAVAFLVGPDASFITGHTLTVDGGLFMP
jgi:3-oxoacyl-[acyl-carrier protein] reductase